MRSMGSLGTSWKANPHVEEALAHVDPTINSKTTLGNATSPTIHLIPNEILQLIFSFVVYKGEGEQHDHTSLQRLCAVSSSWRQTALSHCILWTRPPLLSIMTNRAHKLRKVTTVLKNYLERSGALPVTFKIGFRLKPKWWDKAEQFVRQFFQVLVDHCHRWEHAIFWIPPVCFARYLSSIRGRLPLLRHLEIRGFRGRTDDAFLIDHPIKLDLFLDAPMLREVKYDVRWATRYDYPASDSIAFSLDLPWSQLESYSIGSEYDASFQRLREFRPYNLEQLVLDVTRMDLRDPLLEMGLPPMKLTKLEKLAIRIVDIFFGDLTPHLDGVITPSLRHLEIRGLLGTNSGDNFVSDKLLLTVADLVSQTRCSLTRLCISTSPARAPLLLRILDLCPDLEELFLYSATDKLLERLVFNPSSPTPSFPRLRILTVHRLDGAESINLLRAVIDSRAGVGWAGPVASSSTNVGRPAQALEELNLVHIFSNVLLDGIVALVGIDPDDPMLKLAMRLQTGIAEPFGNSSRRDLFLDQDHHEALNNIFLELEGLDFENTGTKVLMQCRTLRVLVDIARCVPKFIPGDTTFHLTVRARALLKKWKPFVLRDAYPNHWCFPRDKYDIVSVKWRWQDGLSQDARAESERKIWDGITGVGYEDSTREIPWS